MLDYIVVIKYVVFTVVIAILARKVWDMITKKGRKEEKWETFLED